MEGRLVKQSDKGDGGDARNSPRGFRRWCGTECRAGHLCAHLGHGSLRRMELRWMRRRQWPEAPFASPGNPLRAATAVVKHRALSGAPRTSSPLRLHWRTRCVRRRSDARWLPAYFEGRPEGKLAGFSTFQPHMHRSRILEVRQQLACQSPVIFVESTTSTTAICGEHCHLAIRLGTQSERHAMLDICWAEEVCVKAGSAHLLRTAHLPVIAYAVTHESWAATDVPEVLARHIGINICPRQVDADGTLGADRSASCIEGLDGKHV